MKRHEELNDTVGFLQMEEESLETAYYFSWIFFPIWIILTIVQIVCFVLYNGRLHPLARIIDESEADDTGKGKYKVMHTNYYKNLRGITYSSQQIRADKKTAFCLVD